MGGKGELEGIFLSIKNILDFTRSSVGTDLFLDKDLFLPGMEGGSTG